MAKDTSDETSAVSNLVGLVRGRAHHLGEKLAFRFEHPNGGAGNALTYQALDLRAMAIGADLQKFTSRGERALLLYPQGLDFIAAFFGCLYAGVVAVPVSPPRRNRSLTSLEGICRASKPAVVLSTSEYCEVVRGHCDQMPSLSECRWIATDEISDRSYREWIDPCVGGDQLAFLQFTSGSTAASKGVMLSHENLLRNSDLIHRSFGTTPDSKAVFWLPLYHDMGLIGGVIQPIYCGGSCTLLAPATFLQHPRLWLEMISRAGATIGGGPDFAYRLCTQKIPPEERDGLDLSSWEVAFVGAEPVRAGTLEQFADAFGPCGFRREAFYPCYGLAESTLIVSGGPQKSPPTVARADATALKHNLVRDASRDDAPSRRLVGCGECLPGQQIVVVDPGACVRCPDGNIGEIWVSGSSVAQGYYDQPTETQATFHARLADTDEGPFLRTGDLGFLRDGQLFVTGRLKDLIIVRGRNYYPEDIEQTVEQAHEGFRHGHCAAFSVDVEDQERLVVVQEVEPRRRELDADSALRAIRHAIAECHELEVYSIVLARAGSIPTTSSGKTRRWCPTSLPKGCYLWASFTRRRCRIVLIKMGSKRDYGRPWKDA